MSIAEDGPIGLALALGLSKPPSSRVVDPRLEVERLTQRKESLERSLEGYRQAIGQSTEDFEKHVLGKDDAAELRAVRAKLTELGKKAKPKAELPVEAEEPLPAKENEKERAKWRKANSAFHPYHLLGERLQEKETAPGDGATIMRYFDEAMKLADKHEYAAAIGELDEATKVGKAAQKKIDTERADIIKETKADEEKQRKLFDVTVLVKDKSYGFDTDTDAQNFYLANTVEEGGVGTLKKSERLVEMEAVFAKCLERKEKLQKAGATIDEIVDAVYKNIPEALWPNDVVKEVVLYKAVVAQIDAEKGIEEAEDALKDLAEKSEKASTGAAIFKGGVDWAKEKFGEDNEKFGESMEVLAKFEQGFSITNELLGSGFKGLSAAEKQEELDETEDHPVKEKILEFERNKAIVGCVNGLMGLGLSQASEWVPVIGAVTKGKDAMLEVAKAGYYFKNTLALGPLEKGAKTDSRSAALLPLARLAREQKIALSEAAFKAVGTALEAAGKATELAHVAAPVGLALDVTGKILTYGSKAIITGINWSDAATAAKLIKQAAGPPPLRRAQIEVMKNSSKYAKVAVVHLAMKEHDPWAIGHLENVGLEREDIDHPKTTSKLIREYMALKAGGLLGDEQGEEQETFGESLLGKAGDKIADGAEWIRDKVVGRDTKIAYDARWRASSADLTLEDWKAAKEGAIAAGWYDSRPDIEHELTTYAEAASAYNQANASDLDATLAAASNLQAALDSLQAAIREIKPVTNDRKSNHAGMEAFLQKWWQLADQRHTTAAKTYSEYIDKKTFPGKTGVALEEAKQQAIATAVELSKKEQSKKMAARKQAIAKLWDDYEIKTPYVTCKLLEFPKEVKAGLVFDSGPGDFGDTEVAELTIEVTELRKSVLERLSGELMAPADKDLNKFFVASAMTASRYVVEALRAACERLYDAKLKREGKTAAPLWSPKPTDIALDWEVWRKVIDAAKDGGWDQEENTGFTDRLKAYQEALKKYEAEVKKPTPNKTIVDQERGLMLGELDQLEGLLRKFKPVTKQKFHHPGLIAYRDGMLELCLAERIKYSSAV